MFLEEVIKTFPELPYPHGIFRLQNVAEYVYSDEREYISEEADVFNFHLPFVRTWMEFKMPGLTNMEGKILPLESAHSRWGILGQNIFSSDSSILRLGFFTDLFKLFGLMEKIRFMGSSLTRFDRKTNRYLPFSKNCQVRYEVNLEDLQEGILDRMRVNMVVTGGSANVVLMFLNFLACKNVKKIVNDVPPKLLKKKKKGGGPYFERFYTLEIDPMKEVLQREGNMGRIGLKRALHICRGHFAHYEGEKLLFGKYDGNFWRPAHVRGSRKVGVDHKDYNVKAG